MISYQGKPWYELRLHDLIIVKSYIADGHLQFFSKSEIFLVFI